MDRWHIVALSVLVTILSLTYSVSTVCVDSCVGKSNGNYQYCPDCRKYVACSNGYKYIMPCPANLVWDDNMKQCEWMSSTCTAATTARTTTSVRRTTPFIQPITGSSLVCVDSCSGKSNGNYQYCPDCRKYVACSNGYKYIMPCPANLVWDDNMRRCEWTSSTCPEFSTTRTSISVCVDSCSGKSNGNYQYCPDCQKYVACSNGYKYIMPCPASLVWDDNMKRCEWTSSTCPQSSTTRTTISELSTGTDTPRSTIYTTRTTPRTTTPRTTTLRTTTPRTTTLRTTTPRTTTLRTTTPRTTTFRTATTVSTTCLTVKCSTSPTITTPTITPMTTTPITTTTSTMTTPITTTASTMTTPITTTTSTMTTPITTTTSTMTTPITTTTSTMTTPITTTTSTMTTPITTTTSTMTTPITTTTSSMTTPITTAQATTTPNECHIPPPTDCCIRKQMRISLEDDVPVVFGKVPFVNVMEQTTGKDRCGCDAKILLNATFQKHRPGDPCQGCTSVPECGNKMLRIDLEMAPIKAGVSFHVGDSKTNYGYKVDANTQENDAQFHSIGYFHLLYGKKKCPDMSMIMSGLLSNSVTKVTIFIGNEFIRVSNNLDYVYEFCSECLFSLNGQSDTQGPINEDIFIGLNRLIASSSYSEGSGVCSAVISWACPWSC